MNQWKCTKLNTKNELSSLRSYRCETSKTGGGTKSPSPSPDTMDVAEMIPQQFEVDFNEFDCEGVEGYNRKGKENHVKLNNKNPQTTPKTRQTPKASSSFSFGEASYQDIHSFRALDNERLQIEHKHRVKNMAEMHNQVMINLKLQTEILMQTIESLKNK